MQWNCNGIIYGFLWFCCVIQFSVAAVWWVLSVRRCVSVDVAGFSLGSGYADKDEQPDCCAVAQHAAVRGLLSPAQRRIYWKNVPNTSLRVSACACVCPYVLCLGLVRLRSSVPAQTLGWSVLIILKLLHNAIKHYNYHKLNIQNTHWRICGLGLLSSHGV